MLGDLVTDCGLDGIGGLGGSVAAGALVLMLGQIGCKARGRAIVCGLAAGAAEGSWRVATSEATRRLIDGSPGSPQQPVHTTHGQPIVF